MIRNEKMSQVNKDIKINKEEFLRDYQKANSRALSIIKAIKSQCKIPNVNFILSKKVRLINGVPQIIIDIEERPLTKVTKAETDDNDEFYQTLEFGDIGE